MLHGLKKFLEHKAYKLRVESLRMTTQAGSGHPTSALSAADIVAALFFYGMRFDPDNIHNANNDHFILSKGHAVPVLYAAWKELGKLTEDELLTYRRFGSSLEGHPTARLEYMEASTGSLGNGLGIGVGKALADRVDGRENVTYVLMGDSELTEGSVWEAAEIAAFYKLSHLVGIVDCNRLGQSTQTIHGWHAQRYAQKFEAFGWKAIVIDGHDMLQIASALDKARSSQDHPTIIIAKTIKGFGVDRVENKEGFHGKAFSKQELEEILPLMEARFASAAANGHSFAWQPNVPTTQPASMNSIAVGNKSTNGERIQPNERIKIHATLYKKNELIATRMAYGQALTHLGAASKKVVVLDAEVKNSTFAELFEQKYPERFFQCFIAEQNMLNMGLGFARSNKLPFISTFACFLSRAHDQIRMAAIDQSALKICGSHAGVSIGQDGPSQMGLEDIGMMRALPQSIVLYPCDASSTQALVEQMANYDQGISYLRTTREKTPVIYDAHEEFQIGGCKVIHSTGQDHLLIVGAGITLHEALKAHSQLLQEGISVAVIDLYSIKPLDAITLEKIAQTSAKRIMTVEDHYLQGGLGEAVAAAMAHKGFEVHCLAVNQLPMSGGPDQLLAWAGIDAQAIGKKARQLLNR